MMEPRWPKNTSELVAYLGHLYTNAAFQDPRIAQIGILLPNPLKLYEAVDKTIDEATADLKAQLAEAKEQLAAMATALDNMLVQFDAVLELEGVTWDLYEPEDRFDVSEARKTLAAYQAARQPNKGGE